VKPSLLAGYAVAMLLAARTALAAPLPALPDAVARPDAKETEAGLWMIFDNFENDVKNSPLRVRDPALNSYVRDVICKIAASTCGSLRVYIVNDPSFNASAAPNGMVIVNTGLLLRSENEAQLAFVLGHEITHFLLRHSWNRFDSARQTSDILAFFSLGVAAAGVAFRTNLSGLASTASTIASGAMFAYNRNQEREADAGGFELAVKAGYDPRQGAVLWANVDDEEKADPDRREPDLFFATHPTDDERIRNMSKMADEVATVGQPSDPSIDRLASAVQAYRGAWLDQELNRGHLFQSIYLIQRLLKSEPKSGELQFYLGEAYRRRNGQGDLQNAVTAYRASISDGGTPVSAYRGLGIAALKTGDHDAAREAFKDYLSLAPAANDKAMVQSYLARIP